MKSEISSHQFTKDDVFEFLPTFGRGFAIAWHRGPLGTGSDRIEPNGAFVEDIIAAAKDRLEFYQSRFNCKEHAAAILHLRSALAVLDSRTKRCESQGVEGTVIRVR